MKLLRRIGLIFGIIILVFVARTAFLPKAYDFSRSIEISAPAANIFPWLNELEKWEDWNPWLQLDPSQVISYSDPAMGEGAYYLWSGESSGKGKLTLTRAQEPTLLEYRVEFEGWEDLPSRGSLKLTPVSPDITEVKWTFNGEVGDGFFLRWLAYMMEDRVAPSFEKGLENLKSELESRQSSSLANP